MLPSSPRGLWLTSSSLSALMAAVWAIISAPISWAIVRSAPSMALRQHTPSTRKLLSAPPPAPLKYSAFLRSPSTLLFYQNLNLEPCLWEFSNYYDMSELLADCGGSFSTDGQVLNLVQSYFTLHVLLFICYLFHTPTTVGGWQHFDLQSELRWTFVYETANQWREGVHSMQESEPQGSLYPTSMCVNEEERAVVSFRTEVHFPGQLVMSHPVKLIPCSTALQQEYSLPIIYRLRDPITSDLDIRFQQVSDPLAAEFSLKTLFSKKELCLSDGSMGFEEGTNVIFSEGKGSSVSKVVTVNVVYPYNLYCPILKECRGSEKRSLEYHSTFSFAGGNTFKRRRALLEFLSLPEDRGADKNRGTNSQHTALNHSKEAVFSQDLFPGAKMHQQIGQKIIGIHPQSSTWPILRGAFGLLLQTCTVLLTSFLLRHKVCASEEKNNPSVSNSNSNQTNSTLGNGDLEIY